MTIDSKKYDLALAEIQPLIVGLLTAASIDEATASKYWSDTFPELDQIPVEDLPSFLRLHGRVVAMVTQITHAFGDQPIPQPYLQGVIDGLQDRTVLP
jgi:hypothetical protein